MFENKVSDLCIHFWPWKHDFREFLHFKGTNQNIKSYSNLHQLFPYLYWYFCGSPRKLVALKDLEWNRRSIWCLKWGDPRRVLIPWSKTDSKCYATYEVSLKWTKFLRNKVFLSLSTMYDLGLSGISKSCSDRLAHARTIGYGPKNPCGTLSWPIYSNK